MRSPDWRFLVTELAPYGSDPLSPGTGASLTLLDRLARNRQLLYTLDMGSVARLEVPSDNPEVNFAHTDGDPYVSYNNRLLYGFRREDQSGTWEVRFAGTIMQLEDEAQADQGTTHITAYDPWQVLMSRPITHGLDGGYKTIVNNITFNGPGQPPKRLDEIVVELLANTNHAHGTCRIDFGQTGHYTPAFEPAPIIPNLEFTQGLSVGEAWTQMCDTGQIDIVLKPIYDPSYTGGPPGRSGFLSELHLFSPGVDRQPHGAIFAWDMPSRSLAGINHLHDGTAMANKVQFYKSTGQAVPIQTAGASATKYGQYWFQRSVPDGGTRTVELWALAELALRRRGKQTLTVVPVPERSPIPLVEYDVGDYVPVYASNRLREPIESVPADGHPGLYRVWAIPLSIRDDSVEVVQNLLLTKDIGS